MKKQKGITLIALIITIIVMLILVGVTINVALNGGLFNTANKATSDTEKHTIYDQIVGVIKLTDNGTINVEETYSNAETTLGNKGMTVSELGADGKFTVTGKRGTYKYKITETEIIIDPEEEPISNVWIKRGLSSKIKYGKGYIRSSDDVTWFIFKEDGSYSQGGQYGAVIEFTSEQVEQYISDGIFILEDTKIFAVGQWMAELNQDGTMTLWGCDEDSGEYNSLWDILYVEE